MSDKGELLDRLTIDRSATQATGFSLFSVALVALVAALLGAVATWLFAGQSPQAAAQDSAATAKVQAPTPVEPAAATPAPAASDRILNASGYITARRIATVSSQLTGLITEVNVEEGMVVEKGQVLARLDDAVAQVNLDLARARLATQRAQIENIEINLAEAQRVLARTNELRSKSLAPEADVTRSTALVDALKADLRSSRANIEVSKIEVQRQQETVDDHVIGAPFAGVVTVKNAQTGEIVSPGSAGGGFTRTGICTIVDMDSLEITVDVNEAFIGRVFAGQRVEANLEAYPEWQIPASVIAIVPTADRAKATVKVRIAIETKDPRVLPDMGVKVAFLKD